MTDRALTYAWLLSLALLTAAIAHADGGGEPEARSTVPVLSTPWATPPADWSEGAVAETTPDPCDCARRELLSSWYIAEADSPEVRAAATEIMEGCE